MAATGLGGAARPESPLSAACDRQLYDSRRRAVVAAPDGRPRRRAVSASQPLLPLPGAAESPPQGGLNRGP